MATSRYSWGIINITSQIGGEEDIKVFRNMMAKAMVNMLGFLVLFCMRKTSSNSRCPAPLASQSLALCWQTEQSSWLVTFALVRMCWQFSNRW